MCRPAWGRAPSGRRSTCSDRKSTRLNSSHLGISYAVFRRSLPSFPTRRSSDLDLGSGCGAGGGGPRLCSSLAALALPAFALDLQGAPGTPALIAIGGQDVPTSVGPCTIRPSLDVLRSEEHTSELQSLRHLVCRLPPLSPLFPYTTLFRSRSRFRLRRRRRRSSPLLVAGCTRTAGLRARPPRRAGNARADRHRRSGCADQRGAVHHQAVARRAQIGRAHV